MNEAKILENKAKKYSSKGNNNKSSNKFGTGINDKKSFDNIISDIKLDLMKINKKLKINKYFYLII